MGISVEFWRRIAMELRIRYRFVEVDDVGSLLRGVHAGDFDLAVAAVGSAVAGARRRLYISIFADWDWNCASR
jgi:hypothetical protein